MIAQKKNDRARFIAGFIIEDRRGGGRMRERRENKFALPLFLSRDKTKVATCSNRCARVIIKLGWIAAGAAAVRLRRPISMKSMNRRRRRWRWRPRGSPPLASLRLWTLWLVFKKKKYPFSFSPRKNAN